MLKVFLSSTFRDLQEEREELVEKLAPFLDVVHMESFIPDGTQSQEVSIRNLRDSDIAVFLISPYYGTTLQGGRCLIKDCGAECPREGISYTHCEYRLAVAEDKPRMVYLVEPEEIKREFAQKYAEAKRLYEALKEEIKRIEMASEIPEISDAQYDLIASGLATNIARWYGEGKIKIRDFYGRGNELHELMSKIETGDRVLVCGVGGIGKTTLIQVALLLQAMRGKKIISVGPNQSYHTGTGFNYFRSSNAVDCYETQQPETISLYDLA